VLRKRPPPRRASSASPPACDPAIVNEPLVIKDPPQPPLLLLLESAAPHRSRAPVPAARSAYLRSERGCSRVTVSAWGGREGEGEGERGGVMGDVSGWWFARGGKLARRLTGRQHGGEAERFCVTKIQSGNMVVTTSHLQKE
jgi:hypothetical protein